MLLKPLQYAARHVAALTLAPAIVERRRLTEEKNERGVLLFALIGNLHRDVQRIPRTAKGRYFSFQAPASSTVL